MILTGCIIVTLGFASAVEFFCLVITIFYAFDVTSVSSHSCIYLQSLNARIRGSSFHLYCFLPIGTPLWGVRHKRLTVTDGCCYSILSLEATTAILLPRHLSTISATPRIQLRSLNAIIKVNKFPPWLFSEKSNTPLRRKTHAPDSHWWSPLPWLCLLRWQPCEPSDWQQKRQWSDSRATAVQYCIIYTLSGLERLRFDNGATTI